MKALGFSPAQRGLARAPATTLNLRVPDAPLLMLIPRVDLVLLELALQRIAGDAEAAGGLADAACGVLQGALDELFVDGGQHFFVDVAAVVELRDERIMPGGRHREPAGGAGRDQAGVRLQAVAAVTAIH